MKSIIFLVICAVCWVSFPLAAKTTTDVNRLFSDNAEAADALAAYPSDVRQAALNASLYPDVARQIEQQQKSSSEQFQRLLAPYPRKTQERVYNLSRYPQLVDQLTMNGQKSKSQVKDMTRSYPKDIQEAARELSDKDFSLLKNMQALYTDSERKFTAQIQGLPSSSQQAYQTLLGYPEAMQTLASNPGFVQSLGDAYRRDPEATEAALQQRSLAVTSQNQDALDDYRKTLQNDPKAREELQKSAQRFARENGYTATYNDPPPSYYDSGTTVSININPYPYWFGYPFWYAAPFWRPYPLWYYTGYWGWGSSYYVWGFPSYYYTNWFYGYPGNFYYYPNLAGCYGSYYYRYRGRPYYNNYYGYNGFYRGVNNWYRNNSGTVNNNMWRNDAQRSDRWRQYGQQQEWQQRNRINQTSQQPQWGSREWQGRDRVSNRGPDNFRPMMKPQNQGNRGWDRGQNAGSPGNSQGNPSFRGSPQGGPGFGASSPSTNGGNSPRIRQRDGYELGSRQPVRTNAPATAPNNGQGNRSGNFVPSNNNPPSGNWNSGNTWRTSSPSGNSTLAGDRGGFNRAPSSFGGGGSSFHGPSSFGGGGGGFSRPSFGGGGGFGGGSRGGLSPRGR